MPPNWQRYRWSLATRAGSPSQTLRGQGAVGSSGRPGARLRPVAAHVNVLEEPDKGARMAKYTLNVNGQSKSVDVASDTPMLWVLRDSLGLVGTKYGCGIGECGACTIHVDGAPRRACQTPVSEVG